MARPPRSGSSTRTRRFAAWRDSLDQWFPTLLRYAGLGLMVYAALIDRGRNPALIPAATGAIFFKTVYSASNGAKD